MPTEAGCLKICDIIYPKNATNINRLIWNSIFVNIEWGMNIYLLLSPIELTNSQIPKNSISDNYIKHQSPIGKKNQKLQSIMVSPLGLGLF